eukprot:TRINITY_DN3171_c2_g4_i1.p1 TRINITY_DN3171_c2_g4~~TRINITY_DN3171_c2_g4_i1.p1  ORF type:complete len:947 (+),score=325.40 TRINITY_DN3171_c2_g4_i1:61-2901(+)
MPEDAAALDASAARRGAAAAANAAYLLSQGDTGAAAACLHRAADEAVLVGGEGQAASQRLRALARRAEGPQVAVSPRTSVCSDAASTQIRAVSPRECQVPRPPPQLGGRVGRAIRSPTSVLSSPIPALPKFNSGLSSASADFELRTAQASSCVRDVASYALEFEEATARTHVATRFSEMLDTLTCVEAGQRPSPRHRRRRRPVTPPSDSDSESAEVLTAREDTGPVLPPRRQRHTRAAQLLTSAESACRTDVAAAAWLHRSDVMRRAHAAVGRGVAEARRGARYETERLELQVRELEVSLREQSQEASRRAAEAEAALIAAKLEATRAPKPKDTGRVDDVEKAEQLAGLLRELTLLRKAASEQKKVEDSRGMELDTTRRRLDEILARGSKKLSDQCEALQKARADFQQERQDWKEERRALERDLAAARLERDGARRSAADFEREAGFRRRLDEEMDRMQKALGDERQEAAALRAELRRGVTSPAVGSPTAAASPTDDRESVPSAPSSPTKSVLRHLPGFRRRSPSRHQSKVGPLSPPPSAPPRRAASELPLPLVRSFNSAGWGGMPELFPEAVPNSHFTNEEALLRDGTLLVQRKELPAGVTAQLCFQQLLSDGSTFLADYHSKHGEFLREDGGRQAPVTLPQWEAGGDESRGWRCCEMLTTVQAPLSQVTKLVERQRYALITTPEGATTALHVSTQTPDVMYGEYFRCEALVSFTDRPGGACTVQVHGLVHFMRSTIMRSKIQSTAMSELTLSYGKMVAQAVAALSRQGRPGAAKEKEPPQPPPPPPPPPPPTRSLADTALEWLQQGCAAADTAVQQASQHGGLAAVAVLLWLVVCLCSDVSVLQQGPAVDDLREYASAARCLAAAVEAESQLSTGPVLPRTCDVQQSSRTLSATLMGGAALPPLQRQTLVALAAAQTAALQILYALAVAVVLLLYVRKQRKASA